jgi:SNF2 family DNA or RNA helicase
VQVALLSVSAACVGLDFSVADTVVFAELPEMPDQLRQAEARAHRAGSCSAVNVYVTLCKGTREVRSWLRLVQSLERTAALVDNDHAGEHPSFGYDLRIILTVVFTELRKVEARAHHAGV